MSHSSLPIVKGRGALSMPANRFVRLEVELDDPDPWDDPGAEHRPRPTVFFVDDSQSIISENQSPDLPFRYSLNPYRGCEHGCSYCYARPTHEYLDLNAGLDFESTIMVKPRAAELFREWLCRPGYQPESIMFSGVTDCYQPVERRLKLTRACLEVALEARQPIALVSKNSLVARDCDLLVPLARRRLIRVAISLTTLRQELTRVMEPRTSCPAARLRAMAELSQAGVPVHALIAPLIPGLNDHEIPALLKAAREAGAQSASFILLRLPTTVEPVFLEWLHRTHPDQAARVVSRIRQTRQGQLNDSRFGWRMKGHGELAEQIGRTFRVFSRRWGLDRSPDLPFDTTQFRRPVSSTGQGWLFDC